MLVVSGSRAQSRTVTAHKGIQNIGSFAAIVLLALGAIPGALAAVTTVTTTKTATTTVTATPTPSRCGFLIVAYEFAPDCEAVEGEETLEENEIQIPVPASGKSSSCFSVQQLAADSFSFVVVGSVPDACKLAVYNDVACTNQAGSAVVVGGMQDKCFNQPNGQSFRLSC